MTCLCPTCRQPIAERAPVEALKDAKLAGHERIIATELANAYPRDVSIDRLIHVLYAHDRNGGPIDPATAIGVRMWRLRKKLPAYGWTVSLSRNGKGNYGVYRLEPAP